MRKSYSFSAFVLQNDGKAERIYLTVRAMNEEKARKFLKQDVCNLKYIKEWQILQVRREA